MNWPNKRRCLTITLYLTLLLVSVLALGQISPCDPNIEPNADSPLGYRFRENRCEGIYNQRKSSAAIAVVSLTRTHSPLDLSQAANLSLEWSVPSGAEVRLRVDSLRPRLYYRMDAIGNGIQQSFAWSDAIPVALHLQDSDLGFLATFRQPIGGYTRDVFLPLEIRKNGESRTSEQLALTVLPGIEATEVYWSIARIANDGKTSSYIAYDKPVGRSYYPPGRPVRIVLPNLLVSGFYDVSVSADLKDGTATHVDIICYYAKS